MIALIAYYWYGLLLSFGIGLVTAWTVWGRDRASRVKRLPYDEPIDWGTSTPSWPLAPAASAAPVEFEQEAHHAVDAPTVEDAIEEPTLVEGEDVVERANAAEAIEALLEQAMPSHEVGTDVAANDDAMDDPARPQIGERSIAEMIERLDSVNERRQIEAGEGMAHDSPVDELLLADTADEDTMAGDGMSDTADPLGPIIAAHGVTAPVPADNLMEIKGIDPQIDALLRQLGVSSFREIADWMPEDIERIDGQLGVFKGRILRDEWIGQARLLARGDMETFRQRYGRLS